MNYLERIVKDRIEEFSNLRYAKAAADMEALALSTPEPRLSFSDSIRERNGVIAEFKRQSPSKGVIHHAKVSPKDVVGLYEKAGVSAISCLTNHFFAGTIDDLKEAVASVQHTPVLRKEFIVDPFQVFEAKAAGASAILLIAGAVSLGQTRLLAETADRIGLEILMEIHDEKDIDGNVSLPGVTAVGINNRNLKTFEVDIDHSIRLANMLPTDVVKIAESGIRDADDMLRLHKAGFDGFLIGETFMKEDNPGDACKRLCLKYEELCKTL